MGYGFSSYGFSWYDINEYDYYQTSYIYATSKIASRLGPSYIFASAKIAIAVGPTAINASAFIAERQAAASINASSKIASRLGPSHIFASAKIAIAVGPTAINASAFIAERQAAASINASSVVALRIAPYAINAGAAISLLSGPFEVYASGIIRGETTWLISAGGLISSRSSGAINASAKIAIVRQNYVNAGGKVSLKGLFSINAGGLVLGYSIYPINASARVADRLTQPINASANIGARASGYVFAQSAIASRQSASPLTAGGIIAPLLTSSIMASSRVALGRSQALNASGRVASRNSFSISTSPRISQRKAPHSINAAGFMAVRQSPKSINASSKISSRLSPKSINASSTVALKVSSSLMAGGRMSERLVSTIYAEPRVARITRASLNAGGRISPVGVYILSAYAFITFASPYYYLNGVIVTENMLEGLKQKGPDRKLSKKQYPGQEKVLISDEGYDAKEYSFDTWHLTEELAFEYMRQVMDPSGDMRFYPGDSLWFHKVKFIQSERSRRYRNGHFILSNTVTMAKPWLYRNRDTVWSPGSINLPRTSSDIPNGGHYDTPLEALKVRGHYLSGGFPAYLSYSIMDGVNQVSTIDLVDRLLSEELIVLDEDGIITASYADNFSLGTTAMSGTVVGPAQRFKLVTLGSGKIALQSYNLAYLGVNNYTSGSMSANNCDVGPSEEFLKLDLPDGKIALKADNGKYLTATGGGGSTLMASAQAIGSSETFTLVDLGNSEVALKSYSSYYLTVTFASSSARWAQDVLNTGCSVANGKVTVPSGKSFIYLFKGPWPLIENMVLGAKINIISGSPAIDVSNDNMVTWSEVVATADIASNVDKIYFMDRSDHYSEIGVRFRCPVGSSMEIEDVRFTSKRRTTGAPTPVIAAGSTRQIRLSDGAGSTHSVTVGAVFRDRRRAV